MGGDNFGDSINSVFWNQLTGAQQVYNRVQNVPHYLTTGSIMCFASPKSVIYGTGFIDKDGDLGGQQFRSKSNKVYCQPSTIISVRGPKTREKLISMGVDCPADYGDPLILFPCIYPEKRSIDENIVGIIPHYVDKQHENLDHLVKNLRDQSYTVKVIDIEVGTNYQKLIDQINDCKYIISSSLHGMMMGIAYHKQTILIEFSDGVLGDLFKFHDYFGSLEIDYQVKNVYDVGILENIIPVDYGKVLKCGLTMIDNAPFIDHCRKRCLKEKFTDFNHF